MQLFHVCLLGELSKALLAAAKANVHDQHPREQHDIRKLCMESSNASLHSSWLVVHAPRGRVQYMLHRSHVLDACSTIGLDSSVACQTAPYAGQSMP